ncbi:hypothetical protein ACSSVY_004003, partial [Roseovarius sp. MBR-51]
SERAKVDDFYAARDNTMPSLPWPSIAPPFTDAESAPLALLKRAVMHLMTLSTSTERPVPSMWNDITSATSRRRELSNGLQLMLSHT